MTKAVPKGQYITWYSGVKISADEAKRLRDVGLDTHTRCITPQHDAVDGLRVAINGFGGAQFANDGAPSNTINNAVFNTVG